MPNEPPNNPNAPAPEKRSAWRSLRGNVMAMGWVSLLTDFSSEMMNPLLPIFVAGMVGGVEAALWVGLIEGIAETTASVLKLFSGRISDRLGKRKALVLWGYGLSSLARPAMALAAAIGHVVALKFFDRVGKGLRTAPRDALIGDSVLAEHRGLAFSVHRAMDHTGAVLGPATAIVFFFVLNHYSAHIWGHEVDLWSHHVAPGAMGEVSPEVMDAMRWLFALAIVPGLAAMIALAWRVREIVPAAKAGDGAKGDKVPLPRRFKVFIASVMLFALGNSSDMFILLLGYQFFGLGLLQIMVLWIALHVSKIAFSIPGGMLADRFGRRPMILLGWGIYTLVYLGLALAPTDALWLFWLLVLLYGAYYGFSEGAEKALVADFVPSQRRGTAFGVYHGFIGAAALPASLIFGLFWTWAATRFGGDMGRTFAFGIGAALAGIAMLIMATLLATGAGTRKTVARASRP
jgi:MFS family permease